MVSDEIAALQARLERTIARSKRRRIALKQLQRALDTERAVNQILAAKLREARQ